MTRNFDDDAARWTREAIARNQYKVLCKVSGGVTGTRQAFLKRGGQERIFDSREAAQAAADEAYNSLGTVRTAIFSYTVVEADYALL